MTCFEPLDVWETEEGFPTFDEHRADPLAERLKIPCGRCRGCGLASAKDWSARCFHELNQHARACFVTLTYAPEHLPADGGLSLDHLQRFFKRLRKRFPGVRYFACGEYGPKTFRPHYHAVIFGLDFEGEFTEVARGSDYATYLSPTLDSIWGLGRTTWSYATPTNIAYVTAYTAKKLAAVRRRGTEVPDDCYLRRLPDGRSHLLEPEFQVMSRNPGIGSYFAQHHRSSWRHDGYLTLPGGHKQRVPRYYLRAFKEAEPNAYQTFKARRLEQAREAEASKPATYREVQRLRLEARMKSHPRKDT